jgi:FMN phosphatase YigB (HAD superfamily)
MIFVFDLDHTLLNAEKFKLALSRIFKMSRQEFRVSYYQLFGKRRDLYNPYIHLQLLTKAGMIDAELVTTCKQKIDKTLMRLDDFLEPTAENLLIKLKRHKHILILISHGNISWQREKIKHLKLKKYFTRIIITNKNKVDSFKFLRNSREEILIVNDNAQENRAALKLLPNVRALLIKGIHSNNIKHNYKEYSFKQAAKLLINKY